MLSSWRTRLYHLDDDLSKFWKDHGNLFHVILNLPLFACLVGTTYKNAPAQYQSKGIFHLSNLGNWQEGVGWFSFFLGSIAFNSLQFLQGVHDNRKEDFRHCRWLCILYSIGIRLFALGLFTTGCFQQSYNKPLHQIGFVLAGFAFIFLVAPFDLRVSYIYFKDAKSHKKLKLCLLVIRSLFFILLIVIGVTFFVCFELSKKEWTSGKKEWLADHNMTECPSTVLTHIIENNLTYPYYYPCKSKTFWEDGDPGWDMFRWSAFSELAMFTVLVLYSLTYASDLWPDLFRYSASKSGGSSVNSQEKLQTAGL